MHQIPGPQTALVIIMRVVCRSFPLYSRARFLCKEYPQAFVPSRVESLNTRSWDSIEMFMFVYLSVATLFLELDHHVWCNANPPPTRVLIPDTSPKTAPPVPNATSKTTRLRTLERISRSAEGNG